MSRFTNSNTEINGNIEKEFCIKYGSYPDRFYTNKIKDGLSSSVAALEVQSRIDEVWKEMLYNFQRQKAKASA